MADITLTDTQAQAVRDIADWFKNRTKEQQVYRVFGYAGTGKSTLVRYAIAELGLEGDAEEDEDDEDAKRRRRRRRGETVPKVLFGTFTGKAAYILRKKGVPCRTIHSLIYSVSEATEEEIKTAKEKLARMEQAALGVAGLERTLADSQIQTLRTTIKDMRKPHFHLNTESDVRDCKLVVLDECSMVGPEMAADMLSFQKPVLILGDPGQLPPIRGEGAFTEATPDVMLTEIHRQAAESAIIRLATMARQGQWIPYGRHDDLVWKMSRRDVGPEHLLRGGQVICGRNATRLDLNNAMRYAAGFGGELPAGPGEKVICLKNDHAQGLINGMFLSLDNIEYAGAERFRATIKDEEGNWIGDLSDDGLPNRLFCYAGHFLDHQRFDPERHERDWKLKKKLVEATFGYAITCHKAQGSQWENIIVWDDGLARTEEDRRRWSYTAITRAESGLVILD